MKVVKTMNFDVTTIRPSANNRNECRQEVIDRINCQVIDPLNLDHEVARNIFNGGSVPTRATAQRGNGAELSSTDAAQQNFTPSNVPTATPNRGQSLQGTKIDGSTPADNSTNLWDSE
jgi:hypothetical protein